MLDLIAFTLLLEDKVPKDEDVVAGPWGALMWIVLIAATVFLCFSFVKQLRKAQAAKDQGLFGDQVAAKDAEEDEAQADPTTGEADPRPSDQA